MWGVNMVCSRGCGSYLGFGGAFGGEGGYGSGVVE